MKKVKYKCGCSASGGNISAYCPIHGDAQEAVIEDKAIQNAPEGKKETTGKPDWSCLPMETLEGAVRVFEKGAKKYSGKRTWLPGIPFSKLLSAIVRHLVAWYWLRQDTDPESGEHHLNHVIANVMMILTYIDKKDYDDRPK